MPYRAAASGGLLHEGGDLVEGQVAGAAEFQDLPAQAGAVLTLARDAAASDPEIAALLEEISADRLERMGVNARGLADAGHLRPGITIGEATDIMWTYSSPELYELLVIRRGWSTEQHGRFVGQALTAALLPPRAPENTPPPPNEAPHSPRRRRSDQPDLDR